MICRRRGLGNDIDKETTVDIIIKKYKKNGDCDKPETKIDTRTKPGHNKLETETEQTVRDERITHDQKCRVIN